MAYTWGRLAGRWGAGWSSLVGVALVGVPAAAQSPEMGSGAAGVGVAATAHDSSATPGSSPVPEVAAAPTPTPTAPAATVPAAPAPAAAAPPATEPVSPPVAAETPSSPPPVDYYETYPYRTGDPVPPGYRVEERGIRGLVIAGSIVFGVPYFISLAVAPNAKRLNWLAVPIVGPYVAAEQVRACEAGYYDASGEWVSEDDDYCADEANRSLMRFDGLLQASGVAMLTVGLLVRRHVLVRQPPPLGLTLTPQRYGRSGYGLSVSGQF